MNLPLAAFYRQQPERRVEPWRFSELDAAEAEQVVRDSGGWLIVPAARFRGKEGRVMARAWLYDGEADSPFSLVAYRALREGERPAPVLYGDRLVRTPGLVRREMQIRAWEPVRIELLNPGSVACRFTLRTPRDVLDQEIGAGRRLWLEVVLPPDAVSAVSLEYHRVAEGSGPVGRVEFRLLP